MLVLGLALLLLLVYILIVNKVYNLSEILYYTIKIKNERIRQAHQLIALILVAPSAVLRAHSIYVIMVLQSPSRRNGTHQSCDTPTIIISLECPCTITEYHSSRLLPSP